MEASFDDMLGRTWHIEVGFTWLQEADKQFGVRLSRLEHFGAHWAQLLNDDLKAIEVIWLALEGQLVTSWAAAGSSSSTT